MIKNQAPYIINLVRGFYNIPLGAFFGFFLGAGLYLLEKE